jgi:hypothetical protein
MGPRLYMITVPGLEVKPDWLPVHDVLLDEFPKITDVLPTTIPETLLIVYRGRADIDAWLGGVNEAVLGRRMRSATALRTSLPNRFVRHPLSNRREPLDRSIGWSRNP